jgi:hypothetical protein
MLVKSCPCGQTLRPLRIEVEEAPIPDDGREGEIRRGKRCEEE